MLVLYYYSQPVADLWARFGVQGVTEGNVNFVDPMGNFTSLMRRVSLQVCC